MNRLYVRLRARFGPLAGRIKPYLPALVATLAVLALMLAQAHSAYAVTPVPTATPVTLEIPTNTLLNSANDWIATFAPLAAIGIGISIALAVLGYLGTMIVKAFHH